jgi:hypothetical protein
MTHTDYIALFRTLAKQHKDIQHEKLESGKKRNAFFRSEKEFELATPASAYTTVLIVPDYRGMLRSGSTVDDVKTGFYMILKYVPDTTDENAIASVKEVVKKIGFDIAHKVDQLSEDQGRNGPVAGFDLNSVQYDFVGPIGNNYFGCNFFFQFSNEAFNKYTDDLSEVFIED